MVQIFTEKYPELPALFLSYYGLWKTIDFLSDASSWASNAYSSSPKCFAQRCLNIWLIRLCASMISIEIQDRKYPFGHPIQPSALWNCSLSLYTLLTVLFSPLINESDNESAGKLLTTSVHHYCELGLGLHPVTRRKISMWYVQKEKQRKQPKKSYEFITKSLCFKVKKNPSTWQESIIFETVSLSDN